MGLSLFSNVEWKQAVKKQVTHPCIVAVFVGLVFLVLPFRPPAFLCDAVSSLGRCTTPISMLVIGAILADADWKSLFSKTVLFFTFLRLIALPMAVYAVLSLLSVDPLLMSICVLMSGMPVGSITSILADQYGSDSLFASQIVFATTLFSMVTLPMLCLFL